MGYPSPGVLTSSIEAGIPVVSIWEQYPAQVFDFVLPGKSKVTHPRQLKGKTIAIFTDIWRTIINPMLVEVGVDPKRSYVNGQGGQWVQAPGPGQAGRGTRLGGPAGAVGQSGPAQLKFLVGSQWGSKGPSNTYVVRTADMQDATKKDVYTRLLQGSVMGSEFAKANPRAAAQITYGARPLLQKLISPQVAVESMMQLASGYSVFHRQGPRLGLALPVGVEPAPRDREARPDEDAPELQRRRDERPGPRSEPEGGCRSRAEGRKRLQAERVLPHPSAEGHPL